MLYGKKHHLVQICIVSSCIGMKILVVMCQGSGVTVYGNVNIEESEVIALRCVIG